MRTLDPAVLDDLLAFARVAGVELYAWQREAFREACTRTERRRFRYRLAGISVPRSKARFVGIIAGIRGGKTVIGSLAFFRDVTDCPPGSIGLMTGPSLPDIKADEPRDRAERRGSHR